MVLVSLLWKYFGESSLDFKSDGYDLSRKEADFMEEVVSETSDW